MAFLLPFTCDFAIYSPCFKTARHWAVFGGMGVRIYSKWVDARFCPQGRNEVDSGPVKLKSWLQRLSCCSPTSALPHSDRWRGTRLFLAPPDLAVSSPGFHRGRIPISAISVLEGRVEDDEVVVQVRILPVAEPPVLVAEYSFFHHATSEQRSSDRRPLGKMVGGKGPACFANA